MIITALVVTGLISFYYMVAKPFFGGRDDRKPAQWTKGKPADEMLPKVRVVAGRDYVPGPAGDPPPVRLNSEHGSFNVDLPDWYAELKSRNAAAPDAMPMKVKSLSVAELKILGCEDVIEAIKHFRFDDQVPEPPKGSCELPPIRLDNENLEICPADWHTERGPASTLALHIKSGTWFDVSYDKRGVVPLPAAFVARLIPEADETITTAELIALGRAAIQAVRHYQREDQNRRGT